MLVIDIECIGIPNVNEFYDRPKPDGRLTDEEKIATDIRKKELARIEAAALDPWTAQCIAIGMCEEGEEVVRTILIGSEAAEATALGELWDRVWDRRRGSVEPLVTFNGLKYDLPVLLARSALLGVPAPDLSLDRYRSPHPDLMQILTRRGVTDFHSLKFFAKRFGLNTDDAFSGKEIAQLYDANDWKSIHKHVESDVTLTRQLAERIGVLKRRPVLVA